MLQAYDSAVPLLEKNDDCSAEKETTESLTATEEGCTNLSESTKKPTPPYQSSCYNQCYNSCCGCVVVAVVILYALNVVGFALLIIVGDMLNDMERSSEYYEVVEVYIDREHHDMIIYVLAMLTILLVNLGTLYLICKNWPTIGAASRNSTSRFFKAGMAVFGCCKQTTRKEYKEATLPLSDVLKNIWIRTIPCEITWQNLLCGSLAVIVVLIAPVAILIELTTVRITQEGLIVLLCIPALVLWGYLCKLASQGNFLIDEEQQDKSMQEKDDASDIQ